MLIAILSPAAVPDTAGHGCLKPVKSDKRGHILPGVGLNPPTTEKVIELSMQDCRAIGELS